MRGAEQQLDLTFAALADSTRRAMLARLALGEAPVKELAAPFAMSAPAITKHLHVLERAGLITRRKEAQWRPCRLEPRALKTATDWLEQYKQLWEESLDKLEVYLAALEQAPVTKAASKRSNAKGTQTRKKGKGNGRS